MEEDMDSMAAKTSGRVRKKSAKVLEMEEAEKLEKKLSKKDAPRQVPAGKRIHTKSGSGSDTGVQPISPVKSGLPVGQPMVSSVIEEPSGSAVNLLLDQPTLQEEGEPPVELKAPQLGSLISKLKMTLGNPAHMVSEETEISKKAKKGKTPAKGKVVLPHDEETSILAEGEGGLKMKLALSPTGDAASVITETVKPKGKKRKAQSLEEGVSPPAKTKQKAPKSAKKKKIREAEGLLEETSPPMTAAPELLSALGMPPPDQGVSAFQTDEEGEEPSPPPKKTKKMSSKKKASKALAGEPPSAQTSGLLPTSPQDAPHYADTAVMAMRLKTSAEKKASKDKKGKKTTSKDETEKPKKKRPPTAYMLWCNSYRSKVVAENPGIDFAQISKRLGEIWQALPEKEKLGWKRKSKRQAAKAANVLVGKAAVSGKASAVKAAAAAAPGHSSKSSTLHRLPGAISAGSHARVQLATTSASTLSSSLVGDVFAGHKNTAYSPIDVAAHLKLLGESLSIIGARLQEHQGQIAVQGSLSVLLDSLVCALGPLTCLTSQVPELDACPAEVHNNTLDNIAFIMPGIG